MNRHFIAHMYLLIAITYLTLAIVRYWIEDEREKEIVKESGEKNRERIFTERENRGRGKEDSFQDDE